MTVVGKISKRTAARGMPTATIGDPINETGNSNKYDNAEKVTATPTAIASTKRLDVDMRAERSRSAAGGAGPLKRVVRRPRRQQHDYRSDVEDSRNEIVVNDVYGPF